MNIQKRLRGMILGVTVLFVAFWVYADDVTISTFCPSPYGSYKNLDSTDETHLATDGGKIGIGTTAPNGKLDVRGVGCISNGNEYACPNGRVQSGALVIGDVALNYGGGSGWNSNTAGLLFEASDNTEIAIHDSGQRVASLMYYEGAGTNRITIGRDMGWGPISTVAMNGNVTVTGTVTANSDARFKTDLKPLTGILPKLDELQSVNYEPSKLAVSQGRPAGHRELGIVGQELEKVFPELVLRSGPEEYRSVDYSRLSVVLLEALKELKTKQEKSETELRTRIQELESKLQQSKR